jgi:hypothetical protein
VKVWILERHYDFQGSEIVDVFTDQDKAEHATTNKRGSNRAGDIQYKLVEWDTND